MIRKRRFEHVNVALVPRMALWGVLLSGVLSCASPRPVEPKWVDSQMEAAIDLKHSNDPFKRTQLDVSIRAQLVEPGTVQITLINRTVHSLVIGHKFFVLIEPGSKQEIQPMAASQSSFPLVKLKPGEQASGRLHFPRHQLEMPNARLAFCHPRCRPAMARITTGRPSRP